MLPLSIVTPFSSKAIIQSIVVKPVVPIIIACRIVRLSGIAVNYLTGTRACSANPPQCFSLPLQPVSKTGWPAANFGSFESLKIPAKSIPDIIGNWRMIFPFP